MKWILRKYKLYYLAAFVLAVIVSLLNIAGASMLGDLLNAAVGGSADLLFRSAGTIIAVWLFYYLMNKFRNDLNAKIIAVINTDLRTMLADNIMKETNDEWAAKSPSERAGSFTSNVDLIDRNCIDPSLDLVYCFFTLVFSFTALTLIHYSVSILAAVMFLSMLFLPGLFKSRMGKAADKNSRENETMNQTITDCLYGRNEYHMYRNAARFSERIKLSSSQSETSRYRYEKISDTANAVIGIVGLLFQCSFIVLAGYLSIQNLAQVGSVLVVGNLAGTFTQSATMLMGDRVKIRSSEKMIPVLEEKKEASGNAEILPIKVESLDDITVNNHVVQYKQLTMNINKNGKYLIAGSSGSGKSTLLKMLFAHEYPYTGRVTLQGKERTSMPASAYEYSLAYMNQDAYILQDTLRNNLCMGRNIGDEEILSVLAQLGLNDFLEGCGNNLDYVIEDHGKNISGGERQRLCLARALLSKRPVLILDESISAIDEANKQQILHYLTSMKDKTIILAAHNISSKEETLFDSCIHI